MSRPKTATERAQEVVDAYSGRIKPVYPGATRTLDNLVIDIAKAIEAHAKAEVKRVTKDWDHGL